MILIEAAVRSLGLAVVVWIALRVFRVRTPDYRSLAWTAVLFAALTMPLLTIGLKAMLERAPETAQWIPQIPASLELRALPPVASPSSTNLLAILPILYLVVAGAMLARLLAGLIKSERLRRNATPIREAWTEGVDVRTMGALGIPVTFGSTVLLPRDWTEWTDFKRQSVFEHERRHVRRKDAYVHFLASLHRAIFWFSPLSWWLQRKLVALAETACDDAAIRKTGDRISYAEVLVQFASKHSGFSFSGVAMAQGKTVDYRVQRLLQETAIPRHPSLLRRILMVTAFLPLALFAAGLWFLEAKTPAANLVSIVQPHLAPILQAPQAPPAPPAQPASAGARPSPQASPLAPWADQEVPDVISENERAAFSRLQTEQEREEFIRLFWLQRDPTPGTTENEFREIYYRRVEEANAKFGTQTTPGSRTDRGRIWIRNGPPDEIETHVKGETYIRNPNDGTAGQVTAPFERWRYRFLEGIGNNIILEFVDVNSDGLYRLTFDPREGNLIDIQRNR